MFNNYEGKDCEVYLEVNRTNRKGEIYSSRIKQAANLYHYQDGDEITKRKNIQRKTPEGLLIYIFSKVDTEISANNESVKSDKTVNPVEEIKLDKPIEPIIVPIVEDKKIKTDMLRESLLQKNVKKIEKEEVNKVEIEGDKDLSLDEIIGDSIVRILNAIAEANVKLLGAYIQDHKLFIKINDKNGKERLIHQKLI